MRNAFFRVPLLTCALLSTALVGSVVAQGPMPGQPMPGQPMPGQMPPAAAGAAAPVSTGAPWMKGSEGGVPWQIGALFTGFWVLVAAELAILSKPSNRPDKPKKIVEEAE